MSVNSDSSFISKFRCARSPCMFVRVGIRIRGAMSETRRAPHFDGAAERNIYERRANFFVVREELDALRGPYCKFEPRRRRAGISGWRRSRGILHRHRPLEGSVQRSQKLSREASLLIERTTMRR